MICTPGFDALRFFRLLDEERPSWYTAVPTMHQTILTRADRNAEIIARAKLRFIRSSSASLPGPVMEQLEAVFGCPLVESYGMTEASGLISYDPFAGASTPGSVGWALPYTQVEVRRFGADPATASTIFLTMVTDSMSFLAFLGLASALSSWIGIAVG